MAYTWLTWLQARTALAQRLSDTSNVFWTDAECGTCLAESLRVWNALTGYWRERGTFSITRGTAWYDLPTYLPSLCSYTVTDVEIIEEIQRHLIEPPDATQWLGTDQFTLDDLVTAVERRRNQWMLETGMVLSRISVGTISMEGRATLPDTVMDIRRCVWNPFSGPWNTVHRGDEWGFTSGQPYWEIEPGNPQELSIVSSPPVTVQFMPPPDAAGTAEMVVTQTGATLDPTVSTTVLGVPDDWCWAIKWGAMADLLGKDGQARDPMRAQYCETRWAQAVQLAQMLPVVMNAQINGIGKTCVAVQSIDTANPGWEGANKDTPTDVGIAGANLVAFNPVPDGSYSATFDVVRRAPIPTYDTDYVQIGREQWDSILDYAEHIASFKMGGSEFQATDRHLKSFIDAATVANNRLRAAARFLDPERAQSSVETTRRPRQRKLANA